MAYEQFKKSERCFFGHGTTGRERDVDPYVTVSKNGKGLWLNKRLMELVRKYGYQYVDLFYDSDVPALGLRFSVRNTKDNFVLNSTKNNGASVSCKVFLRDYNVDRLVSDMGVRKFPVTDFAMGFAQVPLVE